MSDLSAMIARIRIQAETKKHPHSSIHGGGKLVEIPKPWVRKWPDVVGHGVKRAVSFSITRYAMGYGGTPHYHLSLRQGSNPIWDVRTNAEASPAFEAIQGTDYGREIVGWRHARDDEAGRGQHRIAPVFRRPLAVKRYIHRMMCLAFPDHEARVNNRPIDEWMRNFEARITHQYKREGD